VTNDTQSCNILFRKDFIEFQSISASLDRYFPTFWCPSTLRKFILFPQHARILFQSTSASLDRYFPNVWCPSTLRKFILFPQHARILFQSTSASLDRYFPTFWCPSTLRKFILFPQHARIRTLFSIEQSPSLEANRFSARQEIPPHLWNPNVHYRSHNRLPPVPILSHINSVHSPILLPEDYL
jgi:hypothetical protein